MRKDRMMLYGEVSRTTSQKITEAYSTSFSKAILGLGSDIRDAIYAVYGFVRLVDEVVDSFQGFDQQKLFTDVKADVYQAIDERISTNPVFHAFQETYHKYQIERLHVDQFLASMERDLDQTQYNRSEYEEYITGSAEVVGLMCLKVFVRGDEKEYTRLKAPAIRLGAAFQKVNFLRDIREDYEQLGRSYFPGIDISKMDAKTKSEIEAEIEADLNAAYAGIIQLPKDARFGVYLAYSYYKSLLQSIRRVPSNQLLNQRIRVPDSKKALIWASSLARHHCNLI